MADKDASGSQIRVWDPFVRIGHWTLVAAFFVAYFTEDEAMTFHVWAGYVVGIYVVLRVVWGFAGTAHARFADFAYAPVTAFRYLADLLRAKAKRYIGHSPAGAMMVFALLVTLTGTVVTGMAELARARGEGPLSFVIERQAAGADAPSATESDVEDSKEPGRRRRGAAEENEEEEESLLLELHELFANATLILVFLHIAGVIVASVMHKESLVRAMITGFKRAEG